MFQKAFSDGKIALISDDTIAHISDDKIAQEKLGQQWGIQQSSIALQSGGLTFPGATGSAPRS